MNPWLETGGSVLLALCGLAIGFRASKLPAPYWIIAYAVALTIVGLFGIERYVLGLEFIPPFSWVAAGRTRFVLAAFAGPVLLLTPAERLPRHRDRIFLRVFTGVFLINSVVMPFFLPALIRNDLAAIVTKIDRDGVCLQQTGYTCGPAAAVTGLHMLGLPAQEGQLAIWSHTSQLFGTIPDDLANALRKNYGGRALEARYQKFDKVSDLKQAGITLAVVKYAFFVDHFVTVMSVADNQVTVGDPLSGKTIYTSDEFSNMWRFPGITLRLNSTAHPR